MVMSIDPGAVDTSDLIVSALAEAFALSGSSRMPKHARLYDVITAEIDAGRLAAGVKLPGERDLGGAMGISLGTVQKALSLLVADGRIVREHGRGTFVRKGRRSMTEMWHYRFRDPASRELLPVYARVHSRDLVAAEPPWEDALGFDPAGYVRIRRIVQIGDVLRCWSEMYLASGRFARILKLPLADLASVNLKQVLATQFNAPTLAIAQTVCVRTFPPTIRQALDVPPRSVGLLLQIVATSRRGEAISFQRIYVPPSDLELEIGAETTAVTIAAAA